MIRLFIGIAIPDDIAEDLAAMQGGIPGARWTMRENFHLTLTFIGEVDENMARDIDGILRGVSVPAFDLNLRGVDTFAQGDDPKVLWAGVSPDPALPYLKSKIDRALQQEKIPFEARKYVPHVTIARFKHPDELKIGDFVAEHNLYRSRPFTVGSFILYESRMTKSGLVYEPLAHYPLKKVLTD